MIDFNCDMGEGLANEAEIMPYTRSANTPCGLHAGARESIRQTLLLAKRNGVNAGAHPSFDDRINFGRKEMDLKLTDLYQLIIDQLKWFDELAREVGVAVTHVKPHGALYNMSTKNEAYASCIAEAIKAYDSSYILYGLSNSLSISAARAIGLQVKNEVFADRTYTASGSLTPRGDENALITTSEELVKHVAQILNESVVTATDGSMIRVVADTLCIHGDGVHAPEFSSIIASLLS